MKAVPKPNPSNHLINEIQMARVRMAKTENHLKSAKEQYRLAKRRRREAKAAARLAKKELRSAKRDFAEAETALISAEEKFAAAVERAVRNRKLARARLLAKAAAAKAAAAKKGKKLSPRRVVQKKAQPTQPNSLGPKLIQSTSTPKQKTETVSGSGAATLSVTNSSHAGAVLE